MCSLCSSCHHFKLLQAIAFCCVPCAITFNCYKSLPPFLFDFFILIVILMLLSLVIAPQLMFLGNARPLRPHNFFVCSCYFWLMHHVPFFLAFIWIGVVMPKFKDKPYIGTTFKLTQTLRWNLSFDFLIDWVDQVEGFSCVSFNLPFGSKPITRSQRDYFGKGLFVIFPKKTLLHANEFLNEIFCNLFYEIFKISPMHHIFKISHYWINMNF